MPKIPYIPLYIGDWEQDTNSISLEAEGALLKLIFKLFKSETKGSVSFRFSQLAILFKKDIENTRKIVQELQENDLLNIDFLPDDCIQFKSRRMIKEVARSITNSKNGKEGGRPKKQIKSKLKAKVKRNTEIEYDNEIDIVIEYLNKKAGVNFKSASEKNRKHILARLTEKFKIEDFYQVIDYRVATWGTDEKMKEYLRPETLFGSKFESYLQGANSQALPKQNNLTRSLETFNKVLKDIQNE